VVDWGADHADIKWTKPENDGGSPITGYVIEYKVYSHLFEFKHYTINCSTISAFIYFYILKIIRTVVNK